MDASELYWRVSLEGRVVTNPSVNASGRGDVWGFKMDPISVPGSWTFELTDIGGNVLASGELRVSE